MSNLGFQQPQPASRPRDITEPMPWMGRRRSGGPFPVPGMRHPLGSLAYGAGLVLVGVVALVFTVDSRMAGGLLLGLPVLLLAGGPGVWLLVAAAIRWPWYKHYTELHGHPPF